MGKVIVAAKIENLVDLENRERGMIPAAEVRTVEVTDALVDTGASGLLMPKSLIAQLGLRHFRTRQARGVGGSVAMPIYSAVRLTIQGRECALDVGEIADGLPVLIGQIPLESLDWVVDPRGQCLIGNPEHGGEHIMEVYGATSCSTGVAHRSWDKPFATKRGNRRPIRAARNPSRQTKPFAGRCDRESTCDNTFGARPRQMIGDGSLRRHPGWSPGCQSIGSARIIR